MSNPYVFYFNLNISWTYCSWWINKTCLGLLRVLYNKFPWTEWLKSQILTLSILEAGSSKVGSWWEFSSCLSDGSLLTMHADGWREGDQTFWCLFSQCLLIRALIPSDQGSVCMTSSNPNSLSRAPNPPWGLGTSTCEFGRTQTLSS